MYGVQCSIESSASVGSSNSSNNGSNGMNNTSDNSSNSSGGFRAFIFICCLRVITSQSSKADIVLVHIPLSHHRIIAPEVLSLSMLPPRQ